MNDEIKEILESLDKTVSKQYYPEDLLLYYEDCKLLLDYITNLQQENEELNQDLSYYQRYGADMLNKNNILEERIEKAVEILKKYTDNESNYYVPVFELIDILNGRSDE